MQDDGSACVEGDKKVCRTITASTRFRDDTSEDTSSQHADASPGPPVGKTLTQFTRFACFDEDFSEVPQVAGEVEVQSKPAFPQPRPSCLRSEDGCSLQDSLVSDLSGATEELLSAVSRAVSTAKESGNTGGVAQALYWQTVVFMQNGSYEEAYTCAQEAAQVFRQAGDAVGEARSLLVSSTLDLIFGRHSQALEAADMALCLARLDGDEVLETDARNSHRRCLIALESPMFSEACTKSFPQ
eukprot:TRINITY_DN694_c0_g2_i2.p1 TRINITY_DN694_c0_g2~~TRINITY_DN694_c0_g2_i2.p1  ORF type:complete len:242 (-),score=60.43 TRINITY_DN694_c0_g2_i2:27-752(-)